MKSIWKFLKDEDGLELTEYAIMAALIAIATIVIITALGNRITAIFTDLNARIGGTTP
jgi:pilus assembly protein Flp/PilA